MPKRYTPRKEEEEVPVFVAPAMTGLSGLSGMGTSTGAVDGRWEQVDGEIWSGATVYIWGID